MAVFELFEELTIHSDCSQFLDFGSTFDAIIILIIIWVNRVKLCHIQALIDAAWDGLNFSNQLILDVLQVVAVITGYQIDGQTQVTKTS